MQKNSPSKSTFISLIIIVAVTLGFYFYYNGTPNDNSSLEVINSADSINAQEAGARILSLLNEIKSLRINDSIFNSAVYKSLTDYSITVPEQNVGRVNPFAPVTSGR